MTKKPNRRLRGTSLRNRILAIALVPSLSLLILGGATAGYISYQGIQKQRFADRLSDVAPEVGRLILALQEERRTSMGVQTLGPGEKANLVQARTLLDAEAANLGPISTSLLDGAPEEFARNVASLQLAFAELPRVRQRIDSGQSSVQDIDTTYSKMLEGLVSAQRELSRTAPDADAAYLERFSADYLFAVESMARSRALAVAAFSPTGLNEQQYERFQHLEGNYHELLESLVLTLPADLRQRYEALEASTTWQLHELVEDAVAENSRRNNAGRYVASLPVDASSWNNAAADVQRRINALGAAQSVNAGEELRQSGRDQLTRLILGSLVLLLITVIAFAISIRLSTGVINRLARLRRETLDLAENRLPSLISRLREGERVDVAREVPPLNHGYDEIGQVAEAFNRAQQEAVTAAVREAETRAGTAKVFLNIAHRSQVIVHRQLKVLDQAERGQDDPDQLKLLFQLDHLATRARRNAENLIILGGGTPGRQWRNAVPLLQVIRSAIGESETYVRVTFGAIPDVTLEGAAVADVVHLVAELVDNATNFSPPTARVEVRGNVVGKGVVIEVEDQGLGIEPRHREELNALLHSPPDFSVMALSQEPRLGLFVVAQLASPARRPRDAGGLARLRRHPCHRAHPDRHHRRPRRGPRRRGRAAGRARGRLGAGRVAAVAPGAVRAAAPRLGPGEGRAVAVRAAVGVHAVVAVPVAGVADAAPPRGPCPRPRSHR